MVAQAESVARIFEAELAPGASGAVIRGRELSEEEAANRRRAGKDIVVCGPDLRANRTLAREVEASIGKPTKPQPPERNAGPMALPHFHQASREPAGHAFYETPHRKARKSS